MTRRPINADFAPMIAAGRYSEDVISRALMDASDMRPSRKPCTKEQIDAWDALSKAFGEEIHVLELPAAHEATRKAVDAMQQEADKMLKIPSVKLAYDHFMMVYKLTKDENESNC
jgi:hypothetical protein